MGLIFTIIIMLFVIFGLVSLFGQITFLLLGLGFVILIAWAIVSGIKESKEYKRKTLETKEKMTPILRKHGEIVNEFDVNYLGGHPSYNNMNCTIKLFKELIVLLDYSTDSYAEIHYKDIFDVELVSKEHITQSPTLGKFLIFGVASLAMQEQKVQKNNFIIISFSDSGINTKVIFKTLEASQIYSLINKCRIEYNKEHGVSDYKTNNSTDALEQIKKLSELRDEGILTEDEFQEKKRELLSKI